MSTSDRPYHHGDLRAALLDAGDTLLDEGGNGGFALREAARRAGVTAAAAYRHFPDKDALLLALAARGYAAFGRTMGEAAAAIPTDALNAMGEAYVRFALDRPARFRLMFGPLVAASRGRNAALDAARDATFRALQDAAGDRPRALRAWGLVHGLAMLLIDGALPADEPAALIRELLQA
ncbi:TetR/AcrR family transcriptional regulator [Roseomonas sp. CCTCC AB2023176]|uniref:TetR/AcrR family transcriptional regulator n=1 Tax=Roseomonas sp. CCTCC AB2023176 TaxID=3342640 RepID=UPI0035DBAB3A